MRLKHLAAAAVAAGAVSLALPVAASAAPEEITGRFSVVVGEDPKGTEVKYLLNRDNRTYELDGERPALRLLKPNTQITVTGEREAAAIDVTAVQKSSAALAPALSGSRSVLVMRVYWEDQDGVTAADAVNQVAVVDDDFYRENSYNTTGFTASATQWLAIPDPGDCDDIATINNDAQAAALAAGYDTSVFAHNMIYISSQDCVGRSWGEVPGRITWIQGTLNTYRTAHELGHNLGLGHANSKTCENAAGVEVPTSNTCTVNEYGDSFNVMGYVPPGTDENSPSHISAPQKNALGWLGGTRSVTTRQGTYTLTPTETQNSSLKAIRLDTPGHTYWLEYRRALGFDAPLSAFPGITGGVLIHETEGTHGSLLLDMRANTPNNFNDAALPVGSSWTDPAGHVTVTVNSATATGANVRVALGPNLAVVPDVRELYRNVAGQLVTAAGLVPRYTGTTTGTNLYVYSQSPAAGTIVNRGSQVTMQLRRGPIP
jgi:hypothetical protein